MKNLSKYQGTMFIQQEVYFVFIHTMEKLNMNYSLKNISISDNLSYQVKLIEKI